MIRRPTDTSTRVAAARALSHVSHQVPDAAVERIESFWRAPVKGGDRPAVKLSPATGAWTTNIAAASLTAAVTPA